MPEKEWSENPEDDPVELQKRQLELGKRFLDKMEAEEVKAKEREAEFARYAQVPVPGYKYPTFEEVSARIKKASDEVDRIMLASEPQLKLMAFQMLYQAASGGPFST